MHEKANRSPCVRSSEEFDDGLGLRTAVDGGLRRAVTPAYNPHASLHAATSSGSPFHPIRTHLLNAMTKSVQRAKNGRGILESLIQMATFEPGVVA